MRSRTALPGLLCSVFLVVAAVPSGLAQNTSGIFITPIPDAPFTGVIGGYHIGWTGQGAFGPEFTTGPPPASETRAISDHKVSILQPSEGYHLPR